MGVKRLYVVCDKGKLLHCRGRKLDIQLHREGFSKHGPHLHPSSQNEGHAAVFIFLCGIICARGFTAFIPTWIYFIWKLIIHTLLLIFPCCLFSTIIFIQWISNFNFCFLKKWVITEWLSHRLKPNYAFSMI